MAEGERVVRGALPVHVVALSFLRSSVGAKVIMAITGLGLWTFVIAHLVGNLQIFDRSGEMINAYGVFLRETGHGTVLWILRGLLALAFVAHIFFGIRLAMLNRAARGPVNYERKQRMRTSPWALVMAPTGLLVLVFLVFHLAHFTWGWIEPTSFAYTDAKDRHDVYRMVWVAFSTPWLVGVYIVAQTILLAHLVHGTASLWQSIGWHHRVWSPVLTIGGRAIAALIFIGNITIPLVIMLTWGQPK